MQPQQDQYSMPTATPPEAPKRRNGRKIAGITLLVAPTALIVVTVIIYALMNFAFANNSSPSDGELFGSQSPLTTSLNVLLFLTGALGVLTWLPALIIGIVLLATQRKQ
jgi:hypothetical protein